MSMILLNNRFGQKFREIRKLSVLTRVWAYTLVNAFYGYNGSFVLQKLPDSGNIDIRDLSTKKWCREWDMHHFFSLKPRA